MCDRCSADVFYHVEIGPCLWVFSDSRETALLHHLPEPLPLLSPSYETPISLQIGIPNYSFSSLYLLRSQSSPTK